MPETSLPDDLRWKRWFIIAFAVVAPLAFLFLTTPRLTAQGPFQDELHQAVATFTYLGSPPELGVNEAIGDIPVLNTSYSGAIKTAVYGLYLRFIEPHFSVFSWRLLGILLVAASLGLFAWIAGKSLTAAAMGIFVLLTLTDRMVLLAVRHDWGPVALALAIRLVLIALWLAGESNGKDVSRGNSFGLGCLTAVAIFEKLSSVVLLWPLALIFAASPARRRWRHITSAVGGFAVGSLPLLVVNIHSFIASGRLASLETLGRAQPAATWASIRKYADLYLRMGNGQGVRSFILGDPFHWTDQWEWFLPALLVVALGLILALRREDDSVVRKAAIALAAYVGTAVALKLIPRPTWMHHWILGTPWQYLTIALLVGSLRSKRTVPSRLLGAAALVLLAIWLPIRVAGVIHLEEALYQGKASDNWSPELTVLGEFASHQCGRGFFLAQTWGVSYPIYAMSNGCPKITRELYWNYGGPDHLRRIIASSDLRDIYLAGRTVGRPRNVEKGKQIEEDLRALPNWREVPIPPELAALKTIRLVHFSLISE